MILVTSSECLDCPYVFQHIAEVFSFDIENNAMEWMVGFETLWLRIVRKSSVWSSLIMIYSLPLKMTFLVEGIILKVEREK